MNPFHSLNRRTFIRAGCLAAGASALGISPVFGDDKREGAPARRIKLGLIGCGERGSWIAKLFQNHGGYEIHAVADYFQTAADQCGDDLGVDKSRRFVTLSGYKRVIESGVEAVALEEPSYFCPEHAQAAVMAGLHVYMAKPIAVDVPGCLAVQSTAQAATGKGLAFLVDYQMSTDPANREVRERVAHNGIGKISQISTIGISQGHEDPPLQTTIENRLRNLIWTNDIALGCDYLGNYGIHAIDAAIWVLGRRPVAATGASRICRANPHGDAHDVCSIVYEYDDGLVHNHFGQALSNQSKDALTCTVSGQTGFGTLAYQGKAEFRSFDDAFQRDVTGLYEAGARRNIDTFYRNITEGRFANDDVSRAVDGVLTCILGREAAARGIRLTMNRLLAENKKLEVNLKGLRS